MTFPEGVQLVDYAFTEHDDNDEKELLKKLINHESNYYKGRKKLIFNIEDIKDVNTDNKFIKYEKLPPEKWFCFLKYEGEEKPSEKVEDFLKNFDLGQYHEELDFENEIQTKETKSETSNFYFQNSSNP